MELNYYISVNENYELDIKMSCAGFIKEYKRALGHLGKHGLQGHCDDELLCFEGGSILSMPDQCLSDSNIKADNVNIDISFADRVYKYNYINLDWFGLYDIRKRCFAAGVFVSYKLNNKLVIRFDENYDYDHNMICKKVIELYDYYKNVFGEIKQNRYEIYFLNKVYENNVFAGAGQSSCGFSFDPNLMRDWELLSHRMFHAFCDSNLKNIKLLIPPYLWLYEGLAVYHEMESVGTAWDDLQKRYDYAKEKYKDKLELIPMAEEQYMTDGYKIEFLHYTQAPLIVKQNENIGIIGMLENGIEPQDIIDSMKLRIEAKYFSIDCVADEKLKYFDYILESWGMKND